MNRQQVFALVAVVGLSFGLYVYMQKQTRLIDTMDYEFENVRLTGIGSQAVTLSFDLVLENKSDLDLNINNIDFKDQKPILITENDKLLFDKVVIACGAFSKKLTDQLG